MSSLSRSSVAVVLSSAFVLAIACGSSNKKQAPPSTPPGDGGEAGATPGAGTNAGGAAGTSEPGMAGEGGTPAAAAGGAAGASGAAGSGEAGSGEAGGSGGAGELACMPSGSVVGLTVDTEATYQLCRGGIAHIPYSATASDSQFNCCAVSNAAFDFPLLGVSNGEGGGRLYLQVPADAPLTEQALTLSCVAGPLADTAAVKVTDTPPPIVTSIPAQIAGQDTLQITGSNLLSVDEVLAIPLQSDGGLIPHGCNITGTSQSDTNIDCSFGSIAPGQYQVLVFISGCGAVVEAPLTVTPLT